MTAQPHAAAQRAAEKLKEEFRVGTFSQFCDERADFDEASVEEIAQIISAEYQTLVDAAKALVEWADGHPNYPTINPPTIAVNMARRVMEQLEKEK